MAKLKSFGIDGNIENRVKSYLSGWSFWIQVGDILSDVTIFKILSAYFGWTLPGPLEITLSFSSFTYPLFYEYILVSREIISLNRKDLIFCLFPSPPPSPPRLIELCLASVRPLQLTVLKWSSPVIGLSPHKICLSGQIVRWINCKLPLFLHVFLTSDPGEQTQECHQPQNR